MDGKHGKALSFDGTNDYVEIPKTASVRGLSYASLSLWVRQTASQTGLKALYIEWGIIGNTRFGLWLSNNVPYFYVRDVDEGDSYNVHGTVITPNVWYHLVCVKRADGIYLYQNNVEYKNLATIGNFSHTEPHSIMVGSISSLAFHGVIDDTRVYNRALNETEIQDIFQKGPDFSSRLLVKVPRGITQLLVTLSWQGYGSVNATIESPSEIYPEDMVSLYQRTTYSPSSGDMLNIKRLAITVTALASDESWYIKLESDDLEDYEITVEVQR